MFIKRYIKKHKTLFYWLKQYLLYFRYLKSMMHKRDYANLPVINHRLLCDIKQDNFHNFFGYYDKSPIDVNNKWVLFLRVQDKQVSPQKGEICLYDLKTTEIRVIGHTSTWNWQQAAMMQWVDEKTVSYNIFDESSKTYKTVWTDIITNRERKFHRAAYAYNKNHTNYLSLNFYRLYKFAKGYGYPYEVDSMEIKEDGIWETSIQNNCANLIISLHEVIEYSAKDYLNCQHYINHVAYCPNERYIIFIHRWQVEGGEFVSRLLKYDLLEKKLMTLLDNGHVSHYCWKSDNELLIYATNSDRKKGYMILNIETAQTEDFNGLPNEDGHPSYSPDGNWILTDSYPNNRRDQHVFLFNNKSRLLYKLDRLHSPLTFYNENRCDFHPRWNITGEFVIIDNTDTSYRSLKVYHVS